MRRSVEFTKRSVHSLLGGRSNSLGGRSSLRGGRSTLRGGRSMEENLSRARSLLLGGSGHSLNDYAGASPQADRPPNRPPRKLNLPPSEIDQPPRD